MKNILKFAVPAKSKDLSKEKIYDAEELWNVSWTYIKTVVDTAREPFLILDENLRIISANKTFYSIFQVAKKDTEGKLIYKLGNGQWNIPKLKTLLENILPKNTSFEGFVVEHNFLQIGHKIMILNARRIYTANDKRQLILLAMEDITRQRRLEDELNNYSAIFNKEVAKRTADLGNRCKDLERLNKIMVGRELNMIKLKAELYKIKESSKSK